MNDFYVLIKQRTAELLAELKEKYMNSVFYSVYIEGNKNNIIYYKVTDIYTGGTYDDILISYKYICVNIEYDKDGNTIVNTSKEQSKTHASYPEAYQSDYTTNIEEIKALVNYLIIKYNINETEIQNIQKALCLTKFSNSSPT